MPSNFYFFLSINELPHERHAQSSLTAEILLIDYSRSRIFHSYVYVTITREGLQNLAILGAQGL
jgi:hypothetical protein